MKLPWCPLSPRSLESLLLAWAWSPLSCFRESALVIRLVSSSVSRGEKQASPLLHKWIISFIPPGDTLVSPRFDIALTSPYTPRLRQQCGAWVPFSGVCLSPCYAWERANEMVCVWGVFKWSSLFSSSKTKFRSGVRTQLSLTDICSSSSSNYKLRVGT